MRRHRKAGLIGLTAVFIAGAYAQSCFTLTERIPDAYSSARTSVEQVLTSSLEKKAEAFGRAVLQEDSIAPYEVAVTNAAANAIRSLPENRRANLAGTALQTLSDSAAYETILLRAQRLPATDKLRFLRDVNR